MITRYQRLQAERADLIAEAKEIIATADAEERDLTDDERGRDDVINARLAVIASDLEREERRREWERGTAGTVVAGTIPAQPKVEPEKFNSFGEQLQAIARAYMPGGYIDRRLVAGPSGMGETIGSEGGFLVQQDFATDLFSQAFGQSEILKRCQPVTISTGANGTRIALVDETSRANGSRWGGARAYWASEAGTVTATNPKLRIAQIDLKKLMALAYATEEMLQDAVQLQNLIGKAFSEEMVFAVEDAVIEGTGAGQPLGILNAGCLVSVAKETGQAATTIISENIIKMWARLHPSFKKNAVWLINPDVGPQLDHLTIPAGTGGVKPDYIMYGADGTWRIKGKPVIEVEYASTLGTVGDIILADFSQYYLATKGGVQAASSAHVRFLYDEMTFRFSYRVDGQPKFASALTPLKGSNTLAPFVVVATRA